MNKILFSPVPRYSFREVTDITAEFISGLGIRFLMLDLDNTIAAYSEHTLSGSVSSWAADMKAGGIKLFIISNSKRQARVKAFASELGTGYEMNARKPSLKGIVKILAMAGCGASETALVGDQIYTDTIAANRAGIMSIIVRPRRFTNPLLALRYFFELPLRMLCRNKG